MIDHLGEEQLPSHGWKLESQGNFNQIAYLWKTSSINQWLPLHISVKHSVLFRAHFRVVTGTQVKLANQYVESP